MGSYYRKNGERLQCLVCPHFCKISEGRTGICGVRKNNGSEIELITYGVISGYALDPVEKKPLYHYFPGHNILSVGSYGCNMRCDFCQNYTISQSVPADARKGISPEELTGSALEAPKNIGVAFTYNEPVIWFEFIRDVSYTVRNAGMKTVLVSNGYVTDENGPLSEILEFTDAFNIDLKSFNNTSYRQLTSADLEPVKNTLKRIVSAGKHLEITSLIIPGHNDKEDEMVSQIEWISGELGRDIPFHLSRYFPMFRRDDPATSSDTLKRLYEIASEKLNYVYMGNLHSDTGQDTKCPGCGNIVTHRSGYATGLLNLDDEGRCMNCRTLIYKNLTFLREES